MKKDFMIPKKFLCKITNEDSWMGMNYDDIKDELEERIKPLIKIWQDRENDSDFRVYSMPQYSLDTVLCWICLTKNTMSEMLRFFKKSEIDVRNYTIFDDFNGAGISSIYMRFAEFKEVSFYNSVNHELENMYDYCKENDILPPIRVNELGGKYDVVCSFEVLEHEKEPMKRLEQLLDMTNEYFVYASGFGNHNWIGHYATYLYNGEEISASKMTKLLNDRIRSEFDLAYKGFNSKPFLYKRKVS